MIQQNLEGKNKGQATFGNSEKRKKSRVFPTDKKGGLTEYLEE